MTPNQLFELFRRVDSEIMDAQRRARVNVAETSDHDPRQYDGYRKEIVDGEVREYVLDDSEWERLGANESDGVVTVEFGEADESDG